MSLDKKSGSASLCLPNDNDKLALHKKDKKILEEAFRKLSDEEKYDLLEKVDNGTITSKDAALYDMTLQKMKKDVMEKLKPYIRKGSKVVYYLPSKKQYKARIPKALIEEDKPVPQYAVTELLMWHKLYVYLCGDNESLTLEDLFYRWIEERKNDPDITTRTCERNINTWNKYYKDKPITRVPFHKLTAKKIYDFYKSYTGGRLISRSELGNLKGIFNMIYDYAVVNDIVSSNIAKTVSTRNLKCKIVNNKDKVYTPEERKMLFDYLESIPQNVYTLGIRLMFCLDVRIGELKALRWSDYNEEKGQIYIHNQIVDRKDKDGNWCHLELDYTKSGEDGDRKLPISRKAKEILEELKTLNPNSEFILVNKSGTTIKSNKFNDYLKKYCEACGIRYLSSHKIRFYAVTEQARAGMDLLTIQQNSGHRCKTTTLHYMRLAQFDPVADEKWESVFG
ncbi:MAG: site-specific integrase [Lachnospiraceae bacterium]|nr:site-specific integrase [Lachnospiraceae bacterium]